MLLQLETPGTADFQPAGRRLEGRSYARAACSKHLAGRTRASGGEKGANWVEPVVPAARDRRWH